MENAFAALEHAVSLHRNGDYVGAAAVYQEIVAAAPTEIANQARHLMGMALARSGRVAEGLRQVVAAALINPHEPGIADNIGTVLVEIINTYKQTTDSAAAAAGLSAALGDVLLLHESSDARYGAIKECIAKHADSLKIIITVCHDMESYYNNKIDYSVVVPLYNMKYIIYHCLTSIGKSISINRASGSKMQGEIIVIDDGSDDGGIKVAESWGRQNRDIPFVSLSLPHNHGLSAARNFGWRLARGELIFFCDSDDYFSENHIRALLGVFQQRENLGWAKAGMQLPAELPEVHAAAAVRSSMINLCVRRACLEAVGGFPETRLFRYMGMEDGYMTLLLNKYFRGAFIDLKTSVLGGRADSHLNRVATGQADNLDPGGVTPLLRDLARARDELIFSFFLRADKRIKAHAHVLEKWGADGAPPLQISGLEASGLGA